MTLHTVGPKDMAEDEHKIGKAYQVWLGPILFLAPLVLLEFVELKWVIAASLGAILLLLHEAGGRLHDLCIRLRRTNLLIHGENSN